MRGFRLMPLRENEQIPLRVSCCDHPAGSRHPPGTASVTAVGAFDPYGAPLRCKLARQCRPCNRGRKDAPAAVVVAKEENRMRTARGQGLDAHIASPLVTGATELNHAEPRRRSWRKPFLYQEPQGLLGDVHVRLPPFLPPLTPIGGW